AVVIGAMLVAPLMTPLLAIAISLVQGNIRLFRKAWQAMGVGILGALLASMLVGLLSPWNDLSAEVVARGSPNTFDLATALLSGIAAAFALARPGLAGTLVGVAIAVALVPPLATVGISTIKGEFAVTAGAAVLFLTNLVAIVAGAWLVFRLFGLDAGLRGRRTPRWVLLALLALMVALIPTTGLLFRNLQSQISQGVHRPYARPLPAALRASVLDRVAQSPGVDVVFMAESEIEHGFGRKVVLMCPDPVDQALADDIRAILQEDSGDALPVKVLLLRGVD
ncbi:MAG: DUF389 domain-containing protein, partial [Phycisphaerales bacterium]|nr:DUF389 domain-containing protein [Phycisphaerales bacterium]